MRRAGLAALVLLACAAGGCSPEAQNHQLIDLFDRFDAAEKRAAIDPGAAFAREQIVVRGTQHRAIFAHLPSRITWRTKIPAHATLRVSLSADAPPGASATVLLRIGISDRRTYEGLASVQVATGGAEVPLTVDLSKYGGWKLSLFYQPSRTTWEIIFNAGAEIPAAGARAVWADPLILAPR